VFPRAFTAILAALFTVSLATPVLAHVKVYAEPGWTQAPACSFTEFLVMVPNERPDPTVKIELEIPSSVTVSAAQPAPGWTADFTTGKGRISRITWSGGQLHPREFQTFAFLAATPQTPQLLSWNAHQTYQNGEVVNWTGAPDSDTPHSQITITRPLQPHDCLPQKTR
jgi:uncharacterized protein YcnI